ncbi:endonuclease domain-containing protein [Streptomyces erythrochromogenes]|uniref:endonuclease domain-containing protein n=1 Tax=Streptomyces erythrochromogenes TaxID=285574 RepID=UPI0036A45CEA
MSRTVAGWVCAVCGTAPAAVLDHCHEHGYVRAPVCPSCNTLERPDHLYDNDIRVAGRYQRLSDTDAAVWLRHWHRCPGCRARHHPAPAPPRRMDRPHRLPHPTPHPPQRPHPQTLRSPPCLMDG